jgi:hypothetical protein
LLRDPIPPRWFRGPDATGAAAHSSAPVAWVRSSDPDLTHEPDPRVGPVMVVARYVVPPDAAAPFLEAMVPVRRVQLQTGATSCDLYRDGATPPCS